MTEDYKTDYNKIDFYKITNAFQKKEYIHTSLKKLTDDEIALIHAKGKITPEEMVIEWEKYGLCVPGNSCFKGRCHNFRSCHDCIVDYASQQDEYYSIAKIAKDLQRIQDHIQYNFDYKRKLVRVKNNE